MSYEIIKQIRISEDKKVFLTSASNNVTPRIFSEWECKSLSEILQTQGGEALDYELLKEYENGNFHGSGNKWYRAIKRLIQSEEYKKYSWVISRYEKDCPILAARKTPEFRTFLLSGLSARSKTKV